jgi:hypothetical protein
VFGVPKTARLARLEGLDYAARPTRVLAPQLNMVPPLPLLHQFHHPRARTSFAGGLHEMCKLRLHIEIEFRRKLSNYL